MTLLYKPENHTYWLGKRRLPSVNEILEKVGVKKKYDGDPYYGEIGTASALAIQYYLENNLDESSLAEEVKPRLAAFKKFQQDTGYTPYKWELALNNEDFAGRFDHVGKLNGKNVLLDTKCVERVDNYGTVCQLSGYWTLSEETKLIEIDRIGALRLGRDGNYEPTWYDTISPKDIWKSVWTLYKVKTRK